ncbi:protein kinase [Planctomycetota bacterium]
MADKPKDIEAIYNAALQKASEAERSAYLDAICGDDNVLRGRIEDLLKAHEQAGDFLVVPVSDANVTIDGQAQIEGPGTKIGRYELLEQIGEGGMGLVYLAEQKEPVKRKVALKIVKLGMDTKQVVARFEAERQALALLDHPNIAHVFDAGTTGTGRPYFVMEHVKGMSITRYCDDRKLNIEQRLKLFKQVCEGIHHAHQKGIIHRDIKPSNILVSVHGDRAVPKIIDFGIAKATARSLTDKTVFTYQGQLLGTPEYMSPEQVDLATQDIDTRSDIYSLGVLLYELLAGVLPFEEKSLRGGGFAEIQRTIREQEPATPSMRLTNLGDQAKEIADSRKTQAIALVRRLHRELEWIPLKAMRKDRCRRYRSASEMADDIQNYLNGSPLIAGPETTMYRMQKFVHKHAGSVATVALVAVAVVLGLIVSTAMYLRSEKALEREATARTQAETAEKTAQEQKKLAEQKAEDLRHSLYFNRIALADVSYRDSNMRRVRELLNSCPEDLRGWEWHRLNHVSDLAHLTLSGHQSYVKCVGFSPDGKTIVSGSSDKTLKLWNPLTGKEKMTLYGHEAGITSADFSPDGKHLLVSGDQKGTIKVWDTVNGSEIRTVQAHNGQIRSVCFGPGGERIVSCGGDGTIRLWDTETGDEILKISDQKPFSLALSPDGKWIATGNRDATLKLWDSQTGVEKRSLLGHGLYVSCVAFSPDSKLIVSGDPKGTIKIWDTATGAEIKTLHAHYGWIRSISFSPNCKHIISGGDDNIIKVWDVATGSELVTMRGHEAYIMSTAFSPDGKWIVSGSNDKTIRIWDASIDREIAPLTGHHGNVISVAFSPDGRQIVSGSTDKTVKVWNVNTGTEVMTLRGYDFGIDAKSQLHPGVAFNPAIAFSPDGKWFVYSTFDKTIKAWDTTNGTVIRTFKGHKGGVYSLSLSADSTLLVSASHDNTVKVWNTVNGAEVMTLSGHKDSVNSAALSPDGKQIVSGSSDKTVRLWDVETGAEMKTLNCGERWVNCVSFSPDSKQIVSAFGDGTINVWDAKTGIKVMTLYAHKGEVTSVAFSRNGKRIISGSFDGTVKVWDAATGAELVTLRGFGANSIAFSPDGNTIATGTDDDSIKLWESTEPAGGHELRRNGEVARKVVDELHKAYGLYSKVIDKLKADKILEEPVRKIALQIANSRLWEDEEKTE